MRTTTRHRCATRLSKWVSAFLWVMACAAGGAALHAADPLDDFNVVWDSPSTNASGSMPLGNGDIGLNVWAESDGDLFFYIGKTDSWTGDADYLAKLGRVRVHLDPNPFRKGLPFRQALRLRESEIAISAGGPRQAVRLRLWVDAHHPVIHLEAVSEQPCAMSVTLEGWREAKSLAEERFVGWYRRQEWSNWRGLLTYQHLGPVIEKLGLKDPLINRTFGGILMGDRFLPDGDAKRTIGERLEGTDLTLGCAGTLKSAKADIQHHVRIHVLSAQTATPAEWLKQVKDNAARYETRPAAEVRKKHLAYWNDFWNRSWIYLGGSADAKVCAQGYALQRYITACAGRGTYPIKFNGSLFVDGKDPNDGTKPFNPDNRSWGPCYWFQNTRLIYWPLLAAGDFDEMQPLFRMYREILPLALERTKIYYNHGGAFFPETQFFFGAYLPSDYGFAINGRILGEGEQVPTGVAIEPLDKPRPGKRGVVLNPWIRHEYCGGLELSAMMLDCFAHTGDRKMAAEILVPVADAVLRFYYEHYSRDDKGRLRIFPSAALENQEAVANPMDAVAGLHRVIPGLLALPADLTTAAQRVRWEAWRRDLPPKPMATEDGKPILGTEETGTKRYAREAPELYPIFPYQLYGVGKPDLEMARHTFNTRRHRDEKGWSQVPVQAACLGLTEEARRLAVHYLKSHDETRRFPAFWGPNFDGTPDQCHGGNCLLVLQRMLLQADGSKILLFPAWPKDWDVDFKLHAPMNTTVRCVLRNGRINILEVTPMSRRKDVVVIGPGGAPSAKQGKSNTPAAGSPALDDSRVAAGPPYETRSVAGWTLHIRKELFAQEPELTQRALELLAQQLDEIVRVVPAPAVAELRKVPLYLAPEYPGFAPRAEFHPHAGWLRDHGRDPEMAKGVEFTNTRIFEREMNRMPNFALHELAHAYHNRVLANGSDNPEIKAAYEKAKASGKYDRVACWHGNGKSNTFERAYAMSNAQEFFAENTEALFSRNDFFPFTRTELKQHDPETFALLDKLWGVAAPAASRDYVPTPRPGKHTGLVTP